MWVETATLQRVRSVCTCGHWSVVIGVSRAGGVGVGVGGGPGAKTCRH